MKGSRELGCVGVTAEDGIGPRNKQYVLSIKVRQADKNEDSAEPKGANWLSITGPLSIPLTRSIKHRKDETARECLELQTDTLGHLNFTC